ncbi:MAG: endonuclease/exonuclease/phosphatase family protein [Bacteroidota bacterium]|nr:endonuclease/exonuclease/phosphatase family protein [Bacteroidota bacterium]
MKIIRPLLYVLLVLVGAFLLFLLYATIDDYSPDEISVQSVECKQDTLDDSLQVDLLIWNIGYAGLDASMDFFYDGGKQMRPSREGVMANMEGITVTLEPYRDVDMILLQEVDQNSKRSYHQNQYQLIQDQFEGYHSSFGKNYDVGFVPIPLSEPMGKVESGLMTLSRECPTRVERHSFPGNYSWPMKLFMLDRCFLVSRYQLNNQKELVVINTHNSAYDDGTLRAQQMSFLSTYLLSEYEKGNYVVVGGDWNQTPFGLEPELPSHRFDTEDLIFIEKDYPAPGWHWAYDASLPTNRRVAFPYDQTSSLTTIIDCFLLSPNMEPEEVKTIDLGFKYSDHQPVHLKARLSIN